MNEFEKLCQQNQETVYRYLLALCRDEHLAEELTAETFYRAFLHIDRFRGECKVTTWLCQIARNAYLKEQKKRSRQAALETAFDLADAAHFTDTNRNRTACMESICGRLTCCMPRLKETQ